MLKPSFIIVIVPIDKAASNFPFFCKKFYISKILSEIRLNGILNPTYGFPSKENDEMIHETISFSNKFGSNPDGKDKSLPIMYWTPKIHKEAIGASFIATSKKCNTNFRSSF